jgi:excinuclease UvrABC ATPase subunit
MLEDEIKEKEKTIIEIMARLDMHNEETVRRIESREYQSLLKKTFREWSGAESEDKRTYIRNILANAAATSCHDFVDNQVRLHLFVLAYNLGNFLRQAVLPQAVRHWTLTTLREKLIKIGAKVVRHSRKIVFQMAEVAVPRELFQTILERIGRLRFVAASG